MRLCTLSLALALTLATGCALIAQSQTPEITSIIHVTVVDVAAGKNLADQTVALQSNRIVSVAGFDTAKSPQGRVVDAHGGFLIPGLWDMHVHIQDLEDLPLYIANDVTGVRLMSATLPGKNESRRGSDSHLRQRSVPSPVCAIPPQWHMAAPHAHGASRDGFSQRQPFHF